MIPPPYIPVFADPIFLKNTVATAFSRVDFPKGTVPPIFYKIGQKTPSL
jgi:hypothetical protein